MTISSTPKPISMPASPRSSQPIRASRPCFAKAGRRRCAGAKADLPASPRSSCSQQLSTASAAAIWGRLAAAFDPFHHGARAPRARRPSLQRLGLSAPKIRTLKAIARRDRQRRDRSRRARRHADADEAHSGAHRAARHRPVDRRHLSPRSASAMPTPGRPAISRCRRRRASRSSLRTRPDRQADGHARRDLAAVARRWRRVCCGPIIAPSRGAKRRRSQPDPRQHLNKENTNGRELDGPRLEPRGGQAQQLVVFLHGYGADGNDLIEIGRAWQEHAARRRVRVAACAASRAARRRWAGNGSR